MGSTTTGCRAYSERRPICWVPWLQFNIDTVRLCLVERFEGSSIDEYVKELQERTGKVQRDIEKSENSSDPERFPSVLRVPTTHRRFRVRARAARRTAKGRDRTDQEELAERRLTRTLDASGLAASAEQRTGAASRERAVRKVRGTRGSLVPCWLRYLVILEVPPNCRPTT